MIALSFVKKFKLMFGLPFIPVKTRRYKSSEVI